MKSGQYSLNELSSEIDTSARANEKVRPQFGTRLLTNEDNVFQHNAWDNVIWNEEQEEEAKLKTLQQAAGALSLEEQQNYEMKAGNYWDEFYSIHQNKFFKDRHWLFTEFPELQCQNLNANKETDTTCANVSSLNMETEVKYSKESSNTDTKCATVSQHSNAKYKFLEVGCGVGNTVFPIIKTNNNPDLMVYCCDFSETGVNHVKTHPDFDGTKCHAFVCDISDPNYIFPFPESSLDIVILIFVLSAIHPDKMQDVINRLAQHLKPGGLILFRDYGRYDMAQLRFKAGRCLSANFYVRGDGTRVYFFSQDELKKLFETAGLEEVQNLVDRRLQVNRGKQLKMFRVWIQCKYRKPVTK